jgi:hypothetical protein
MKKLLLPLLLLLLASDPALAQSDGEVVQLPINWQVGEIRNFKLKSSRDSYKGRNVQLSISATTTLTVEVLEKSKTGYVIRWEFGELEITSGNLPANPILDKLMKLMDHARLDFRTNPQGTVTGLVNKQQTAAFFQKMVDEILDSVREIGAPPSMVEKLEKGIAPFASTETVESQALKNPSIFHLAVGSTYHLGSKWDYEDILPNPLGGDPIPSKAFFLLREVKQAERVAVIEWRQSLDPEKTRESMMQAVTAMIQRMDKDKPLPKPDKLPTFVVNDSAEFAIDLNTGWPIHVIYERETRMADRLRIDRKEYRMIPDD